MSKKVRRFKTDLKILCEEYGRERIFWPDDASWVMVAGFNLPQNFKQTQTNILILIPDNYGYGGCFEDNFIDPHLQLLDKSGKKYRKLSSDIHGFRKCPYSRIPDRLKEELMKKDWLYLCVHDTDPQSSLSNYLFKVNLYLSNPYKDWSKISAGYK